MVLPRFPWAKAAAIISAGQPTDLERAKLECAALEGRGHE
jgi:hypothetical protein